MFTRMMAKILSRYSVNTLLFITLMVVLFSSASATAENRYTRTEYDISQLSDFPIKQLNRDINHIINQHKQAANRPFNGVIMVSRAHDVLYQYASSNEFDAETLLSRQQYVVGSISKTITAILVMQAVDEQLIKLDDVAVRYLDNQIDPQITIAHLLSHTSGIQTRDGITYSQQAIAGSQFNYSNQGYLLLGKILAKVYQQPYAELLRHFANNNQLKLNSLTGNLTEIASVSQLVTGYVEHNRQLSKSQLNIDTNLLAFGALQADATSITKLQHLLHNHKLLSQQSYGLMTTPKAKRPHRWGDVDYGFGLQLTHQDNIVEYSHSGYIEGYVSLMMYYPQQKISVVILENTSWELDDMARVFGVHDDVRQAIRKIIQQ